MQTNINSESAGYSARIDQIDGVEIVQSASVDKMEHLYSGLLCITAV
jgi:hypothetical protein